MGIAFVFTDAALVLLWTTPVGCICLWSPQARVHMDVRLDGVLCRSHESGNAKRQTVDKGIWF